MLFVTILPISLSSCGSTSTRAPLDSKTKSAPATPTTATITTPTPVPRTASRADTRAIASVVKRYYAAAAVTDGARACKLLYWYFEESVVVSYGEVTGPKALRGKTCRTVLTKLFRLQHRQLVADAHGLVVTGARITGTKGIAVLRIPGSRQRHYIQVHLDQRLGWRIEALLDSVLH